MALCLDFVLVGYLLGQSHDVEVLEVETRHVVFELRYGIQIADDVYQAVDALLGAFEILAVDELVFQTAVEKRRNVTLDVEYGCFQLVRHVAQILFAELLDVFEPRYLLVVVRRPCRQLLRYVLDMLVAKLVDDLARVHVAREHDRVYWFELVGHVFADDEQRRQRYEDISRERYGKRHPPLRTVDDHDGGDDSRCDECGKQRSKFLGFDSHYVRTLVVYNCKFGDDAPCLGNLLAAHGHVVVFIPVARNQPQRIVASGRANFTQSYTILRYQSIFAAENYLRYVYFFQENVHCRPRRFAHGARVGAYGQIAAVYHRHVYMVCRLDSVYVGQCRFELAVVVGYLLAAVVVRKQHAPHARQQPYPVDLGKDRNDAVGQIARYAVVASFYAVQIFAASQSDVTGEVVDCHVRPFYYAFKTTPITLDVRHFGKFYYLCASAP